MHLFSQEHRFCGGYAIVGEALPIACGTGYSINYREKDEVVMSIFGDGATNIGAFHESLNVAKLWHLPIVFVCVNNLYGMGTAVNRASAVTMEALPQMRRQRKKWLKPARRPIGMLPNCRANRISSSSRSAEVLGGK